MVEVQPDALTAPEPAHYSVQRMYRDCYQGIGSRSAHQVVTIRSALPDTYGTGTFKLTLGSPTASSAAYSSTGCLPYSLSTAQLQQALEQLPGVERVFVEVMMSLPFLVASDLRCLTYLIFSINLLEL